jgi:hypothetical protein
MYIYINQLLYAFISKILNRAECQLGHTCTANVGYMHQPSTGVTYREAKTLIKAKQKIQWREEIDGYQAEKDLVMAEHRRRSNVGKNRGRKPEHPER